jgi:exo-beta-1,3-glucanase (GH17 family)
MRRFIVISMLLGSAPAFAFDRGINYDPAHSPKFVSAQAANNLPLMVQEINNDLQAIKNSGFTIVKTFYSSVSTIDGKKTQILADLICPMGMQVMIGVYEFNPNSDNCADWCKAATQGQVNNAIASVKKYSSQHCILGIAVGNEDIYNWNFTVPQTEMQQRIATDISSIKQATAGKNIPVGSAQQDGAWLELAKKDPYGIIKKIDFIGANIYPFWSPQKPNVESGKKEFMARLQAIKTNPSFKNKEVMVTEEGWPSNSSSSQNRNASEAAERAYYQWWTARAGTDTFDSYYFGMFDKQPTNSDADKYFGLCTYDRKNQIINTCN